jgi:hypothetical protein
MRLMRAARSQLCPIRPRIKACGKLCMGDCEACIANEIEFGFNMKDENANAFLVRVVFILFHLLFVFDISKLVLPKE